MNNFTRCGGIISVSSLVLGKATMAEEGQAPEEKVAILGCGEDGDRRGFLLSYGDTWGLAKDLLKLLAGSGDGVAKDARRMLCPKDRT